MSVSKLQWRIQRGEQGAMAPLEGQGAMAPLPIVSMASKWDILVPKKNNSLNNCFPQKMMQS